MQSHWNTAGIPKMWVFCFFFSTIPFLDNSRRVLFNIFVSVCIREIFTRSLDLNVSFISWPYPGFLPFCESGHACFPLLASISLYLDFIPFPSKIFRSLSIYGRICLLRLTAVASHNLGGEPGAFPASLMSNTGAALRCPSLQPLGVRHRIWYIFLQQILRRDGLR